MATRITIVHHGHCFDGMASAALLGRYLREVHAPAELEFRGIDHQPGGSHVPEDTLSGEVNAVVDFRYTTSPRLTWFFDHHASGIVGDEERRHFEADRSNAKFFDPTYGSCCKLIRDVLAERFGFEAPELAELVRWAHLIDTARFPDAETAVALKEPATQLMTVLEVHGDDRFLAPRIAQLMEGRSVEEIALDETVQSLLTPLRARHAEALAAIESTATDLGGVVTFDLGARVGDRYNKFIPYWLFPDSRYCVGVTIGHRRAKVSVGSNPWASQPRTHDISALCAKYGGGGHPAVGAVSFRAEEIETARKVAAEIAAALREEPSDRESGPV